MITQKKEEWMKLLEELIYQALFLILNALINSSKVSL